MIHGGVHFHHGGRAAVGLPYRAGTFPPRAAAFQDRDTLAGVLDSGDAMVLTSDSVVVSGLGGVGKTQVALDYATGCGTPARRICWCG